MNAGPITRELNRIRSAVGSALRTEKVADPAPQSLIALLKELETVFATRAREGVPDVRRGAELLRAAGRQPRDVLGSEGANADEKVHI